MKTDTWLAISAGATFLLALAAFWAIWQNYSLQRRGRKERLLNEIIEWATDVIAIWQSIDVEKECEKRENIDDNLVWNWRDILARGNNVHITAAKYFGRDLGSIVVEINTLLIDVTEFICSCRRGENIIEFPKETLREDVLKIMGITGDSFILKENKSGQKIIEVKDFLVEELGRMWSLACDLLEKARKIEAKEIC